MPRLPYIFVGTPSPGMWRAKTAVCAYDMGVNAAAQRIISKAIGAEGAYTEANRTNVVTAALTSADEVDAIMWIDSDMVFPPDTLAHLWGLNLPIAGATYRERQEPYRFLGRFLDPEDELALERGDKLTGLRPMRLMPGGMILVRMEVYRVLGMPWYDIEGYESGKTRLRDDYFFCQRAIEAGYMPMCDMDLTAKVKHRGEQDVGWFEEGELAAPRTDDPKWKIFGTVPNGRAAPFVDRTVAA